MTEADLSQPAERIPNLAPRWHWMAWITRVGSLVIRSPEEAQACTAVLPLAWRTPASAYPPSVAALDPYAVTNDHLVSLLKDRRVLPPGNPTDPARKVFRSETGEITIDAPNNVLVLDTPRTAGGFAPVGRTIETERRAVRITVQGVDATVWVSALDSLPITESRHLLVTHLTDLQNTGIRYAEAARQTLLDWGSLPHLVRAGQAGVGLQVASPDRLKVWALATSGRRMAEVPARVKDGRLEFTADVAGDASGGARMLYEIAEK
jgi:hypothetical protein